MTAFTDGVAREEQLYLCGLYGHPYCFIRSLQTFFFYLPDLLYAMSLLSVSLICICVTVIERYYYVITCVFSLNIGSLFVSKSNLFHWKCSPVIEFFIDRGCQILNRAQFYLLRLKECASAYLFQPTLPPFPLHPALLCGHCVGLCSVIAMTDKRCQPRRSLCLFVLLQKELNCQVDNSWDP